MPIKKGHVLDEHICSVILDADTVIAARHVAVPHRDVVRPHKVHLVLPRAVPWLPVRADASELDVAGLLWVIPVDHGHVPYHHILAIVNEHHAREVRESKVLH